MSSSIPRTGSRYRGMLWVAVLVLGVSLLTRIGLLWYEGDQANYQPALLFRIFAVGLTYDLAALSWMLIPFSLIAFLSGRGDRGRTIHAFLATVLLAALILALFFNATAEFIFWNEFSSRFNFIAVDYLVFTREVVGNIQQSYPFEIILAGIAGVSVLVFAVVAIPYWRSVSAAAPRMRVRLVVFLAFCLLPAAAFFGLDETLHKHFTTPSARELASNGVYCLFRAFRNNELSYARYYRMLPEDRVREVLVEELRESHAAARSIDPDGQDPMLRHINAKGPAIRKNLVLVSIESLGSDYVDAFDGARGLTPNLDALAEQSLIFKNFYATGLRTVRGLEAITLSLPPTPGRAVPMREHNKGLPSLGSILKQQGYEPLYLYGGYSWFDNMYDFFTGSGYTVIDRTAIRDAEITHETIWGVADEDLYRLALREMDARFAAGQPFFAHIMTTSNHRPYTYPEGRVSIPSHTGRRGAVQYTDWAIGEFVRKAKTRPWFAESLFVFVADHTSHGRGRIDLPPENYRIPLLIYAPGFIEPRVIDAVTSQLDLAPTVLALLNIEYDSHFFGQDMLHEAQYHSRAFMANYLTVGYMERGMTVELGPRRLVRVVDAETGREIDQNEAQAAELIEEAVSYYQQASAYLERKTGLAGENKPRN